MERYNFRIVPGESLLFNEIPNFSGKLLQNYKYFEYKIFRILLKQVSNHLSILFQFA